MEPIDARPAPGPRSLAACRPTGWRHAARVVLALCVALPAIAAMPLLYMSDHATRGWAGAYEHSFAGDTNPVITLMFLVAVASGAMLATRRSWVESSLAGVAAMVVGSVAALEALFAHRWIVLAPTAIAYVGVAALLSAAGAALALGDPLLHILERRRLTRDVDPVVATARVIRSRA